MEWFNAITDPATVAAGASAVVDLAVGYRDVAGGVGRKGCTLTRIIGTVRVNSTDASLSAEGTFGFVKYREDAGLANVPFPSSDDDAPWLYWKRRVFLPASDSGQHIELDVKSQRKFNESDDNLLFVIQNDDATQSLEFALGLRMLWKLP